MTKLQEKDLEISFPSQYKARKFDDQSHELHHCMKAVDFIVERETDVLFIEFKDPDHPNAPLEQRAKSITDFKSGKLDANLVYKYRDTWLYEWASERNEKPIRYLVLIAGRELRPVSLLTRMDALKKRLPLDAPTGWTRPIAASCGVFNLYSWNRQFPDMQIQRISESSRP